MLKCGEIVFKTVKCNQIDSFHPHEEDEEDDEEEDIWRNQKKLVYWVQEQWNLDEPPYCNGIIQMVNLIFQKCVIFQKSQHLCISPMWSSMFL